MSVTYVPYGPAVRQIQMVADGGTLKDLGALGVLISAKVHATEQASEDLAGPQDVSPQNEPTGIVTYSEIELVVKHTKSGSDWVLMDEAPPSMVGSSAVYDFSYKLATGETYTGEYWLVGWEPETPAKGSGKVKLTYKIATGPTYA